MESKGSTVTPYVLSKHVKVYQHKRLLMDSAPEAKSVVKPVNWVFIIDRSGSMTHMLSDVVKDALDKLSKLNPSDTLTLGYYSSEGIYAFDVVGLDVGTSSNELERVLNTYKHSIGMTCFSEIMGALHRSVAQELKARNNYPISLMFFTDGYPVVRNYNNEVAAIESIALDLQQDLSSALWVGYGDYYNRDLMAKVAVNSGGTLVHASHLQEYSDAFAEYVGVPQVGVKVLEQVWEVFDIAFSVEGGKLTILPYNKNQPISGVMISEDWSEFFTVSFGDFGEDSLDTNVPTFLYYAVAHVAMVIGKLDLAMEVVNVIGDTYYFRGIYNAWTNAERGKYQNELYKAIYDTYYRLIQGRMIEKQPADDAFCLLDALDLMAERNAEFYPRHKYFSYKRIGVAKKQDPSYPVFSSFDNVTAPLSDLVYNQERMNLSVRVTIPGFIHLDDRHSEYNLPADFPTFQWKTYTLIRDGVLNVNQLPVSMDEETYDELLANGMIQDDIGYQGPDHIYPVNLAAVPMINRKMVTPLKARDFCDMLDQELELTAEIKVLKNLIEKHDPKQESSNKTIYTPEQMEYLKSFGVRPDGSYAPPLIEEESKDHYQAPVIENSIKSFSSLPKIDDVILKIKSGKSQTASGEVIAKYLAKYLPDEEMLEKAGKSDAEIAMFFKGELDSVKGVLAAVRSQIQRIKFGMLMSKQWFSDLSSYDETITVGGRTFTFKFKTVDEEY